MAGQSPWQRNVPEEEPCSEGGEERLEWAPRGLFAAQSSRPQWQGHTTGRQAQGSERGAQEETQAGEEGQQHSTRQSAPHRTLQLHSLSSGTSDPAPGGKPLTPLSTASCHHKPRERSPWEPVVAQAGGPGPWSAVWPAQILAQVPRESHHWEGMARQPEHQV